MALSGLLTAPGLPVRHHGHACSRLSLFDGVIMKGLVRSILLSCLLSCLLGILACSGSAEELFETARFEEQQNNRAHARQLYREIIRDFPESEYASKARERLTALQENQ